MGCSIRVSWSFKLRPIPYQRNEEEMKDFLTILILAILLLLFALAAGTIVGWWINGWL
jgi:hypothetical protein